MSRRFCARALCVLFLIGVSILAIACAEDETGLATSGPAESLDSPRPIARGEILFRSHCELCHGLHGAGDSAFTRNFLVPPRNLLDRAWRRTVTPKRIFMTISEGRPGTAMPSFRSLPEQDRWDLVAYVLSLRD